VLISRRGSELWLVTQPDHATLSGELAEAWGNERFAALDPHESVVIAAAHHDDGWYPLDTVPTYNEEERRPAHLLEVPLTTTVPNYGPGVESVYERDTYAGVLSTMHWSGLYSARWGVQAGAPVDHPIAISVVEEQERRWTAAARELWAFDGLRSAFEAKLWRNYELLQNFDLLSLALCLVDLSVPTDASAEPVPVPVTLKPVDQPPGARIVPKVPTGHGDEHVDIRLEVVADGVVEVDPYPFSSPTFKIELPARVMEDRSYDQTESASAYAAAPVTTVSCTLQPKKASAAR
jgi:Protein of unknown function (DUF3891)